MNPETILAAVLLLALAGAWVRLLLWRARAEVRPMAWQFAALMALQPVWIGLFYLMLLPPRLAAEQGRLIVLTADWRKASVPGGHLVALPEARSGADVEQAPDLATALRRHAPAAITVVGRGLEARDRDGLALPLAFAPAPLPDGIVALVPPAVTAPGTAFRVAGQAWGEGSVELDDPAGRRLDATALPTGGAFTLRGTARVPGLALLTLKLRDSGGMIVEQADVPLRTEAPAATRLLLLGTPDPETKYLRRWATDAGLTVDARLAAGGRIALGTMAGLVSAGTLQHVDMIVVDDRGWAAAGPGEHAAILAAVRGGAGLLLRATGPLAEPVARDWRTLGIGTSGGQLAALALPKEAIDAPALAARRGPGGEAPISEADVPALTRSDMHIAVPDGAPFAGPDWLAPLARWRAFGRGRIGIETITDSYALALGGQRERYGELWSSLIGTLAPPKGLAPAQIETLPHVGERTTLCGIAPHAIVHGEGGETRLVPDPAASGCAGYWPKQAGWHSLGTQPFYVWPADQLLAARAAQTRDATLALVRDTGDAKTVATPGPRGASWPWFLGWLAVSGLLWWLERARLGRSAPQMQRDQQPGEDEVE